MESTQELATRIDAAFASLEQRRKQSQELRTRKHDEWKQRIANLGMEFDTLRNILKPRLDLLLERFGDRATATPRITNSTREVVLAFQSEVARIRLRFQGTTDHDIRNLVLSYDLEITPALMQFDTHSTLEMRLDAIDYEAAAHWVDERIMSFVQTYIALHESPYYDRNHVRADCGPESPAPARAAAEWDSKKST
jgi:hypothetical protein